MKTGPEKIHVVLQDPNRDSASGRADRLQYVNTVVRRLQYPVDVTGRLYSICFCKWRMYHTAPISLDEIVMMRSIMNEWMKMSALSLASMLQSRVGSIQ